MIEPMMWAQLAEVRHQDLLREARLDRLCREARTARPVFRDRFLLSAGELLICVGKGLQQLSLAAGHEADLSALGTGWENG